MFNLGATPPRLSFRKDVGSAFRFFILEDFSMEIFYTETNAFTINGWPSNNTNSVTNSH